MKNNMILHCGAKRVTEGELLAVPTPDRSRTHVPIPHHRLYSTLVDNLGFHGYEVAEAVHGVTPDGLRYFGMVELRNPDDGGDGALLVGLRNSHDKRFPAAIAGGSRLFVCDNLSFCGEVKVSRKHTSRILDDLPHVVHRAVGKLAGLYTQQEQRKLAYQNYELTPDHAKSLLVEAVRRRVLGCTHLLPVLKEWEAPQHEEFSEPTLWRMFNAVTEVAKGWPISQVMRRTQLLHGLCDAEAGLVVAA